MSAHTAFSTQFYNIDDSAEFGSCWSTLQDPATRNFAIGFDAIHAQCATNLKGKDAVSVFNNGGSQAVRWLNFWGSESQEDEIQQIASYYNLSPRLATLLCLTTSGTRSPKRHSRSESASHAPNSEATQATSDSLRTDVEKVLSTKTSIRSASVSARQQETRVTSFGDVIDDIWHFCSVDWGPQYLYVGFNALFTVPGMKAEQSSSKPDGQRIWTSLVLCDDGTVISVFENPPMHSSVRLEAIKVIRRNVLNIFRQLSKLQTGSDEKDALMKVNIRARNDPRSSTIDVQAKRSESASLLLYYLFDDWITTYGLIAKREHPYRDDLETLREKMFETADVGLIKSLHLVGRRLTVLKLMYQSYDLIISRVLQRQRFVKNKATPQVAQLSFADHSKEVDSSDFQRGIDDSIPRGEEEATNVRLTSSAVVRFERLLDRIRLYALAEIQDCLQEKESLVFMNFNLVALKESQAVEKLTRTTILLAKATIMFLPVSLMTAYFSIQIGDLQQLYTLKTYWLCFLVVALASVLLLFAFSIANFRVEGRTVYRSFTSILWDKGKAKRQ